MANIAFFGLGAMGAPIARNLVQEGHQLAIYDISAQACQRLESLPVRIGRSPADTASGCDIIITLLPTSLEVHQTLHGLTGALQTAAKGAIFIDMSTGSHADFLDLHRELAALEMYLIDCPIARGPDDAEIKKNLFLVGGEIELIDRIRPVLAPICEELIHCGLAGSALMTKIVNNYLAAVSVVANAEALALASACGLDRDFLRDLFKRTVAGKGALEVIYPNKAFSGDYTPGFSARLASKDLTLAQELGDQHGVPLATGAAAREMFALQKTQGRIDEDWSALLDVLERMRKM